MTVHHSPFTIYCGPPMRGLAGLLILGLLIPAMNGKAQTVADFQRDFASGTNPGADHSDFEALQNGWGYFWNAPAGWTTNGGGGDGASRPVGAFTNYQALVWGGGTLGWTADGDTVNANNQPSGYLRLSNGSGHPGLGSTQTGNVGNSQDRYVIAAYEIQAADGPGNYRIAGSSIAGTTSSGTPHRVYVHVNDDPPLLNASFAKDGQVRGFDLNLGLLSVGDRVFVCVGPDGNAGSDSFVSFNFSVVRADLPPIPPNPPPPPVGGPPQIVLIVNPGAEINGGVEGQTVGHPDVPGWRSAGTAFVTRQEVGPKNGRWRYAIGEDSVIYQMTGHTIASNHAYTLRFEASTSTGLPQSIVAELFVDDGAGGRIPVSSKVSAFDTLSTNHWHLFELVSYFGELDAHAGKTLGVQFRGPSGGQNRAVAVDDIELKAYDGGIEPGEWQMEWGNCADGIWPGPDFWANRPQDWALSGGWLECIQSSSSLPMRTVHLLTRWLNDGPGSFTLRAKVIQADGNAPAANALAGFLIGAGPRLDYRGAALVHHSAGKDGGLLAGMDAQGRAVVRDNARAGWPVLITGLPPTNAASEVELEVSATCLGAVYRLDARVLDSTDGTVRSESTLYPVDAARLIGNVAVVSHGGDGSTRYRFNHWLASGAKFDQLDDRRLGPMISAQHTLSDRILKMTAQLMPVATSEVAAVSLQINTNGSWQTLATEAVNPDGYVALFRVPGWEAAADIPYRLETILRRQSVAVLTQRWTGTVRADPVEKPVIVLVGFTGNMSVANKFNGVTSAANPITWTEEHIVFPHNEVVEHVAAQDPDILFFSGDQVYEGGNPTRADTANIELDYLYKWYLWCWAYRDLAKEIPCLTIPDDHDVYQGNLWGQGGRAIGTQENGGYTRPASFVKMVERTQTANLPDPYDPTPVDQGIGVYYTQIKYGRIGLAVIEDRKFKHGQEGLPPRNATDPNYDTDQLDLPDKELLGPRQEAFLEAWAQDWRLEDMKAVLSQTLFADMNTHGGENLNRRYFDLDTNGWPQSKRRRAVDLIRRAFALMIGGDQHLATVVHHGIATYEDAGFSFCVPSVLNAFPRCWDPLNTSSGTTAQVREYRGQWLDGFKHPVTVHAAANPAIYYETSLNVPPATVHDRAAGYGLVRFDKATRTIRMECWPRYSDPRDPATGGQYPDWPVSIRQTDNYGRAPFGYLSAVQIPGLINPVVKVIDESNGEVLYTLRANGERFRPHVFAAGSYTVHIGEPDTGLSQVLTNQTPVATPPHRINAFEASARYVISNSAARLSWDVEGAVGLSISPGANDVGSNTFNGIGQTMVLPLTNTTYTLTSSNEAGEVLTAQVGIQVFEDQEAWRQRHFTAPELADPTREATLWGDQADPDADGIANVLEFALTTDPRADSRASLPRLSIVSYQVNGTNDLFLTLTYRGILDLAGVSYTVETSSNLETWQPMTNKQWLTVDATPGGAGETARHTDRSADALTGLPPGHRFFRMTLRKD